MTQSTSTGDEGTLLTVEEAADLLQLTPHTIRKYCREGKIEAVKFGNIWRISARVVGRYALNKKGNTNDTGTGLQRIRIS